MVLVVWPIWFEIKKSISLPRGLIQYVEYIKKKIFVETLS